MQTPKRPASAAQEDQAYTPYNPFQSEFSRISAENVDSLNREQVVHHTHTTLQFLHDYAKPPREPVSRGAWFPASSSNYVHPTENLASLTLCRMIDCVHKDPAKRNDHGQLGLIGVGAFVMDAEDFGRAMIKQTPKAGDQWHVHDAMADVLGAGSFNHLKIAELFIQGHEWLTERVENQATSQSDRKVWTTMNNILSRVEISVTAAMQHGLIDDKMAGQIVMRQENRARELGAPYKDWAAPVSALLESVTNAVVAKNGDGVTPALDGLAITMTSSNKAYENAKTGRDNLVEMPSSNRLGLDRPVRERMYAHQL